ncbi:MAG: endonuclease III [Candidatus Abawacabacteria bacterium RIFCSPHIGHO2_01_FULL_46_8]|uniref:Endonuclease III n=1 Tax=Candidatus Abawacabacteria bacterium RIFCSPHIGHO2_01_FULL_46_8 TaxID=1817815 RepID=A0A1F4XJM5_9BACT|nr:MAG: endonuclease III [Candidatus Abawacabacteria bacterium RIFCSPHIGHO2_01_FULL_46_8]
MDKKTRAGKILLALKKVYTVNYDDFLHWSKPLELLVATVLAAQCTDKRVNMVTPHLFKKYQQAADYAQADLKTLEQEVRSTGFYRNKAKSLKGIGQVLLDKFKGEVPQTMADLLQLPGVAHKTANLIMGKAFHKNTGVAVDTHVTRLSHRFQLTEAKTQQGIERELNKLYPAKAYLDVNEYYILHGRAVCKAPKPKCPDCMITDLCPAYAGYMKQYYPQLLAK